MFCVWLVSIFLALGLLAFGLRMIEWIAGNVCSRRRGTKDREIGLVVEETFCVCFN